MKTRRIWNHFCVLAGLTLLTVSAVGWGACGMSMDSGAYNEFGATQGGVQDMTLARSLVEEGKVPPAEAFAVEAMFSEHDLPLTGDACDSLLCLRAALGVAPDAEGQSSAWVQVGMSSTVDPATFVRPSTTIVATVDVSGSMGWDYPNETTAGSLSRRLLHEIADQLDPGDRFAMVTFGSSSQVVLPLTSGADQQEIHAAIDALREDGSTDMEAGLRTSIPIAQGALGETQQVRIMVFSDYNPNVGATTPAAFQQLVSQAADVGIGVTLFGLGLGLSPDVMKAMSEIRGANAFSAVDTIDVDKVMEDSWPWMVCPIAYDLRIGLKPSAPLGIAASFGFPGEAGDPEAALEVATVFLSRRKGGMLIKLLPTGDIPGIEAAHAELQLDYVTPAGEPVSRQLEASYDGEALDESGRYMPQIGIAKATALALLVSGMREAAERYEGEPEQAMEILGAALARYTSDVTDLEDAALNAEISFGEALLALMQQGASQGNFY